jgi:hypothetical protein
MQLTRQDIQIVEKVVHTENGAFLARFAVANIGGVLKAKLVSMIALESPETISNTVLLLENPKVLQTIVFIEPTHTEIVSPYSELFFLSSISPRAPNFVA